MGASLLSSSPLASSSSLSQLECFLRNYSTFFFSKKIKGRKMSLSAYTLFTNILVVYYCQNLKTLYSFGVLFVVMWRAAGNRFGAKVARSRQGERPDHGVPRGWPRARRLLHRRRRTRSQSHHPPARQGVRLCMYMYIVASRSRKQLMLNRRRWENVATSNVDCSRV